MFELAIKKVIDRYTDGSFNTMITIENAKKLKQEAVRLLNAILAKEVEPYFKLIFEDRLTREGRANALFKEN